MHRALPAAVLTALVLALSGCGGSGGGGGGNDDGDAKASKAISDSLMKNNSSTTKLLKLTRKDADCIGDGLVDKVGTERLQKYGLLTKDNTSKSGINDVTMSATDARATTKVLFGCTDVEAMMESAIIRSGSIPAKVKTCVTRTLTEDNLRPVFDEMFQGKQDEATKALTGPITKCAAAGVG
jgi:hypothetical protein